MSIFIFNICFLFLNLNQERKTFGGTERLFISFPIPTIYGEEGRISIVF